MGDRPCGHSANQPYAFSHLLCGRARLCVRVRAPLTSRLVCVASQRSRRPSRLTGTTDQGAGGGGLSTQCRALVAGCKPVSRAVIGGSTPRRRWKPVWCDVVVNEDNPSETRMSSAASIASAPSMCAKMPWLLGPASRAPGTWTPRLW